MGKVGNRAVPGGHVRISKRLILSYIMDWVFIIGVALIGFGFSRLDPNQRPFSLDDPSISFPHKTSETVKISVAVVASLVAPGVIIAIVALFYTPGAAIDQTASQSMLWRRRLWEWNAGWMGLALATAGVFMATEGLKDLNGKPRPDMLARCNPDLSKIATYAVSGLGQQLRGAPTLVTWEICRNKADVLKMDGFSSFPSGHSSFSFAGLTYLTLWLCSKFSIKFPYLSYSPFSQDLRAQDRLTIRNQGAAPPVYLVVIAFVPIAVASFIASSRWFDYRHHGFDIIFGSTMGIAFAFVGFYLYSPPIMRGSGWSWGARSSTHAFFKTVGLPSHTGEDGWSGAKEAQALVEPETEMRDMDLESGRRNLAE